MPAVTDAAGPPEQTLFGVPQVDVSELYQPTTAYIVSGLDQGERIRPRDKLVIPMITVHFTVPGIPGLYTIGIDNYAFTHADPTEYLRERAYDLKRVWSLPDQLPAYADVATPPDIPVSELLAAAESDAMANFGGLPGAIAALEGDITPGPLPPLVPPTTP